MNSRTPKRKAVITNRGLRPDLVDEFSRFRKRVFVDELNWKLLHDEHTETDEFDTDAAFYALITDAEGKILAGFRAVPTVEPYLVQTHFPHLAVLRPFPARNDFVEISRFGIDPSAVGLKLGLLNYGLMLEFAKRKGFVSLVALSDLHHERLLRAVGFKTRRYGPPGPVGSDTQGRILNAVAGDIPILEQSPDLISRFASLCHEELEISDDTEFLGRERLSA